MHLIDSYGIESVVSDHVRVFVGGVIGVGLFANSSVTSKRSSFVTAFNGFETQDDAYKYYGRI